jgi:hypothetical protein
MRGQRGWPAVVGAAAFVVLGVCAGMVLIAAPPAGQRPGLASRSNWALAAALPPAEDFPADWNYTISGALRRILTPDSVASSGVPRPGPRAVYEPSACTDIPSILNHFGAALGPQVGVDESHDLVAANAELTDALATGQTSDQEFNAYIQLWVVPDGPARIANYVAWLSRCGTYQVTNYGFQGELLDTLSATTAIDSRVTDGADAAAAVSITFAVVSNPSLHRTYHVVFYAVRDVVVECRMYMQGKDIDVVKRRATQTVQKLRAL